MCRITFLCVLLLVSGSSLRPVIAQETSALVVFISGFRSDASPDQIARTAARGRGTSGLYQLMVDLEPTGCQTKFFNWNGTSAGQFAAQQGAGPNPIVESIRSAFAQSKPNRLILVGHSWGGHTMFEVADQLSREPAIEIGLAIGLDASSFSRGDRIELLPKNVKRFVNYYSGNSFCWGEWKDEQRVENIYLGDPANGFVINGMPNYASKLNWGAHNAAEWDSNIHTAIIKRIVELSAKQRATTQEASTTEKTIEFPLEDAIRGSELVLKSPATVLIGEIHGTWETPMFVASLVRSGQQSKVPTVLCVEMAASEQVSLDQFLQSDGGEAAVAALLSSPHWSNRDGRSSVGMFAMIELMRRLNRQGGQLRVVAVDMDWESPGVDFKTILPKDLERLEKLAAGRDRAMSEAVLAARKKFPESNMIVLAGNIHTKLTKGLPWDSQYTPMGWYIAQELPHAISLNVQNSGGQAWVATEKGVGPTRMNGADRGSMPFIELYDHPQSGYHGVLYVGQISAADPILDAQSRDWLNKQ